MKKRTRSAIEINRAVRACRSGCAENGRVMCVDALAATLGMSCDELLTLAREHTEEGRMLAAAVQECTAETVAAALGADPKSHPLWMFYLRNRAAFADKPEVRAEGVSITFVGEERL